MIYDVYHFVDFKNNIYIIYMYIYCGFLFYSFNHSITSFRVYPTSILTPSRVIQSVLRICIISPSI